MTWLVSHLYLIPLLPLLVAAVLAITPARYRRFATRLSLGAMTFSFALAVAAFAVSLGGGANGSVFREFHNFDWFQLGGSWLRLGWVMDPLAGVMIVMVTLVATLVMVFSVGYMAHDANFVKFFCYLSLFTAAMLGLVIANSLLLLFICWEVMGFASYILIGFWFHKPSAAAAAKKAFLVTRIGDLGLLLGMLWLYSATGTLLFYDDGSAGCLEFSAIGKLLAPVGIGTMTIATAIALLIFIGAIGKSGQLPLHVWLPDAMEGPTPVSALIHAATMVAAGVFLVARVFPVFEASAFLARAFGDISPYAALSPALIVVAWTGALTAVFAALVAVAQNDIKRILAYSTVSQLGYMFMGLGLGGIEVGLFHLITHAFFKSLLFLGSGSVIHGCHEQQDIRWMGGLRRFMPVTFAAYAVGMMTLSGVPLFFSGFWSKDEIMHAAMRWEISIGPYYLGILGAFLTAFYMTRQMCYVFAGQYRGAAPQDAHGALHAKLPHESPGVMTGPLIVLASIAVLLSAIGTPVWPWFHHYLVGQAEHGMEPNGDHGSALFVMALTSIIALVAIGLAWRVFGSRPVISPDEPDPLQQRVPRFWRLLGGKFFFDEFYAATFVRLIAVAARLCDWFDRFIWDTLVQAAARLTVLLAALNRLLDEFVINLGFDDGCFSLRESGRWLALVQNGQVQRYLRLIALALALLAFIFIWGLRG